MSEETISRLHIGGTQDETKDNSETSSMYGDNTVGEAGSISHRERLGKKVLIDVVPRF